MSKSAHGTQNGRPSIPGWVKGFIAAGLVLAALASAMLVTGHGPGRHFGAEMDTAP
jgi:hypothetical protein